VRSERPSRLLLATGNQKKLKELREILTPVGISVVAPNDVGYQPDVEETGTTFEANAILKAEAGVAATGMWTIADDSGIEARALNWRPGVYSARYAGQPCDDEANNQKLILELASQSDKYVQYRCVIALARPGQPPLTWSGVFAGEHTANRTGSGGFGYDPYVFVPELGKTVAELTNEEKHARSHRGQALRGFMEWLALAEGSGSPEVRKSGSH
jgi:XTP/dITP diphosphohydrolase